MASGSVKADRVVDLVTAGVVTPISSAADYATADIDELSVKVAQVGHVVQVNFSVVRTGTGTTFRTIATGLPAPKLTSVNFPSGTAYYSPVGFGWMTDNPRYLAARVQTSGNLQIAGGGLTGTFHCSFVYLTDSLPN